MIANTGWPAFAQSSSTMSPASYMPPPQQITPLSSGVPRQQQPGPLSQIGNAINAWVNDSPQPSQDPTAPVVQALLGYATNTPDNLNAQQLGQVLNITAGW